MDIIGHHGQILTKKKLNWIDYSEWTYLDHLDKIDKTEQNKKFEIVNTIEMFGKWTKLDNMDKIGQHGLD